MPTYEFRCPSGHSFERFYRKIADAVTELECPVCGKPATRQLSGGAGLVFKGSGFYLTDYGKNAHRKPGPDGGSSGESKSDSGGGESKSASPDKPAAESKSESKSETKSSEPKAKDSTSGGSTKSASTTDKSDA